MENHYNCIYMYVNKINNHKYVGQAKDFNKRHLSHLHSSKTKNNKDYKLPVHKAFRKYGIENFEILILKENIENLYLMNYWECYYIEKYNCLSEENYNISSGGSNGNNFAGKNKEEMKEISKKMSDNNGRYWKDKELPVEMKKKISLANKKTRGMKVLQFTKDMEFIKEWECIRDIERELKIANQNISKCCRKKRKTAGGFIWRYKED